MEETEFRAVIQTFAWGTGTGDTDSLEEEIKSGLVQGNYASDREAANALFESLFFYVFKRLTEEGLKTLTVQELHSQLSQPLLGAEDLEFLADIRALGGRVTKLEREVAQDRSLLQSVNDQVQILAGKYKAVIEYQPAQVSLDVPEVVKPSIPRVDVVDSIVAEMNKRIWVNVVGEPGSGKTQLCLLAAGGFGPITIWINLRALNQERSCAVIDATLEAASEVKRQPIIRDWYLQAAGRLTAGTIIVLDDLPRVIPGSALDDRIQFLRAACQQQNLWVLSTTYYELPNVLIESGVVGEVHAPRFTADEILELLQIHGAPASVANTKFAEFLKISTGGLPVIVAAVVKFLISKHWMSDPEGVESLLKGEYATGVKQDARRLIEGTVPDLDTRELLYRLTCIVGPISKQQIEAVGKVSDQIQLTLKS